ncbi:MAG: hypothetical protein V4667_11890 [Bacteroidota bacterium]
MKKLVVLLFAATMLLACSKEKKLARRLDGIWTVTEMKSTFGSVSYSVANPGTIEFKKDGTGKNNFSYLDPSGDKVNDSESFKWTNTENTVTINGNSNSSFGSTTVWTVDNNEKKEQKWTANYGVASVTLTMTKN